MRGAVPRAPTNVAPPSRRGTTRPSRRGSRPSPSSAGRSAAMGSLGKNQMPILFCISPIFDSTRPLWRGGCPGPSGASRPGLPDPGPGFKTLVRCCGQIRRGYRNNFSGDGASTFLFPLTQLPVSPPPPPPKKI